MTILAHPDDAEIWVGGTLRNHILAGAEALCCIVAAADHDLRAREATAGASLLGADVTFLGGVDRSLQPTGELVERTSALLQQFRPTIIITHWGDDSHPDHVSTYDITRRAIVGATGLSQTLRHVLSCDTYLGQGRAGLFQPDVMIDVTDVWIDKVAAINVHQTQSPDQYVQAIERQCWIHGARSGVKYAEGFRHIPVYGRMGAALTTLL